MNQALFSSASVEWATPQWLYDALNARFSFTLDPCCTESTAKCSRYYTSTDNGLAQSWAGERVFMNPPYGRCIAPWVEKARKEAAAGALVVGLLPARVDTEWWQENVNGHADIRFLRGRIHFVPPPDYTTSKVKAKSTSAGFPSAIAVWWGWMVHAGWFVHE